MQRATRRPHPTVSAGRWGCRPFGGSLAWHTSLNSKTRATRVGRARKQAAGRGWRSRRRPSRGARRIGG
eukprot:scaffold38126_cov27-Tisochrysis_lutea.AAC.1